MTIAQRIRLRTAVWSTLSACYGIVIGVSVTRARFYYPMDPGAAGSLLAWTVVGAVVVRFAGRYVRARLGWQPIAAVLAQAEGRGTRSEHCASSSGDLVVPVEPDVWVTTS